MKSTLAILTATLAAALCAQGEPEKRLVGYANGKPMYVKAPEAKHAPAPRPAGGNFQGGGSHSDADHKSPSGHQVVVRQGYARPVSGSAHYGSARGGCRVNVGCTRITHGGDSGRGYYYGGYFDGGYYAGGEGYGYGDGYGYGYGDGNGYGGVGNCGRPILPIRRYIPCPNPARPIYHPFHGAAAAGYANIPRYAP